MNIRSWPQFARKVRRNRDDLLRDLPNYPNSILISGCQRSGGTMLAHAFNAHPEVEDLSWSKDAELDAAQLLAGAKQITPPANKRCCFQTTYLNERGIEYLHQTEPFHLIWLIRNPYSVVYSMLHNWAKFALNEVFIGCGIACLPATLKTRYERWGLWGISPTERACYAYLGKLHQASKLLAKLPPERMTTLQYEELVANKDKLLADLFEFTGLEPMASSGSEISTRSLKKQNQLSNKERIAVDQICTTAYEEFLVTSLRIKA